MDLALALAGLAAGVAATPHCAAMCGAPCAALVGGCTRRAAGFHAGRIAGYMAGGALAAGSMSLLGAWSRAAPALRPLWVLLHLALLALGLWWLATGRQPGWLQRGGAVPVQFAGRGRPLRAGLAGLAWVAWPCAALQAALLLASQASGAAGGALVMAAFALGSMPSLVVGPWAWRRLRGAGASMAVVDTSTLGFRAAGVAMVLASGWALGHGLWLRVAAWCAG